MKKINLPLCAAMATLLAGCIVTSVYPFYTEKDLVFDPAMTGDWLREVNDGPPEIWKFEKSKDKGYRFVLIEESNATVFETHLFKLENQLFLEISSIERDYHIIPPHYLLKVSQLNPTLRLSEMNYTWLKDLLAREPGAIRHHLVKFGETPEEQRVVLTADTGELQKFVLKHLGTAGAWKDSFELKRSQ